MPHSTMGSAPVQAIILCGPGVSLNTFTSNPADFPKALVPIANKPMVWYPLDWCYRAGITNITLITPPDSAPPLEAALNINPSLTSLPSPKPTLLVPPSLTQSTGTAELLRLPEVQEAIVQDFLILPCDLLSEIDAVKLLEQWMLLNPITSYDSDTMPKGGLALIYPTYGFEGVSHKKDETDFLATVTIESPVVQPPHGTLRQDIEQIVMTMPTDTLKDKIEEDGGFFRLRQSLMEKHPRVKLRMKHRDAGVYFFPRWVKDFARVNETFESIGEDVVGWWSKAEWQGGLGEKKLGLREVFGDDAPPSMSNSVEDISNNDDASDEDDDSSNFYYLSSTNSAPRPVPQLASRVKTTLPKPLPEMPRLLTYVHPLDSGPILRRIDTTAQLLAMNIHLASKPSTLVQPDAKIHSSASLDPQARVTDSLIAGNVTVGGRTVIKESVIGANCEIGKGVRILRSLLMDGVVVGDGAVLVGCVVGRRSKIEGGSAKPAEAGDKKGKGKEKERKKGEGSDGTRLTDCEVAPYFVVEAGVEMKGEKIQGFDTEGGSGEEEEEEDGDYDGE